eukprot:gene4017-4267_t
MGRKEPDLSKLAKTLTSKRLACSEEIRTLMDCMAGQLPSSRSWGLKQLQVLTLLKRAVRGRNWVEGWR